MKADEFILDEGQGPYAQARSWLVRLKSGDATRSDLGALARWRASSDVHERAYQAELQLWHGIGQAANLQAPNLQAAAAPIVPPAHMVSRRWMLRGGAGLALSAAVGVVMIGGGSAPAGATTFETGKGERRRFRLGAGLDMELNTDSRIFFWAGEDAPRLTLDRGEAMIHVAYHDGRQLEARVNEVEVTARQASFVLRDEDGASKIACLEGDVSIRAEGKAFTLGKSRTLTIEENATLPVETPTVESEAAWQNGLFVFRDRPAGEVVTELNRYRSGHVFLPGDQADVRISGVIRLDRIDLAVDHIARSLHMKVVRLPGGLVLLRG